MAPTSETSGVCAFCYKTTEKTYSFTSFVDEGNEQNKPCKSANIVDRFLGLLERFGCGQEDHDSENILGSHFNWSNWIGCCEECMVIVDTFCADYHQMKCLELRLEWKLESLVSIMKLAGRVPSRMVALQKTFESSCNKREIRNRNLKRECDDDNKIRGKNLNTFKRFRQKFIKNCTRRLSRSQPRVLVKGNYHANNVESVSKSSFRVSDDDKLICHSEASDKSRAFPFGNHLNQNVIMTPVMKIHTADETTSNGPLVSTEKYTHESLDRDLNFESSTCCLPLISSYPVNNKAQSVPQLQKSPLAHKPEKRKFVELDKREVDSSSDLSAKIIEDKTELKFGNNMGAAPPNAQQSYSLRGSRKRSSSGKKDNDTDITNYPETNKVPSKEDTNDTSISEDSYGKGVVIVPPPPGRLNPKKRTKCKKHDNLQEKARLSQKTGGNKAAKKSVKVASTKRKIDNAHQIRLTRHKCLQCGKSYKIKEHLERHALIHKTTDAKNVECSTCRKVCPSKANLVKHMMSHKKGSNGKLPCQFCGKVYIQFQTLRDHVRTKHMEG